MCGEQHSSDDDVREDEVLDAPGNEREDRELHRDGAGDDPGEARSPRERWKPTRTFTSE